MVTENQAVESPKAAVDAQQDVLAREAEAKRILAEIAKEKAELGIKRTRYTPAMAGRDAVVKLAPAIFEAVMTLMPEGIKVERIVADFSLSEDGKTIKVDRARTYLHNPNAPKRELTAEQKLYMKAARKVKAGQELTTEERKAFDAGQKAKASREKAEAEAKAKKAAEKAAKANADSTNKS